MARGRSPRRRQAPKDVRPQPRTWEWLALALVLVGVAGYFLRDAYGYALRDLGSIIWVLVLAVTFLIGLGFFARFLVPAGWQEGWHLLVAFYTGGAGRAPRPVPTKGASVESDPMADLPASLWTLGAGLVGPSTVLALVRGNHFARAVGPGFVRLEPGERIGQVIDLRPQLRTQEVTARTRDGIPVKTTVSVRFQLRRPPENGHVADLPYPYDPEAVFQVTYAGRVHETQDILPWHAQLAPEAAARVVAALSNYTLDQLYGDATSSGLTLAQIRDRLERDLSARFEPRGVTVLSIGMSPLVLPEDVVEQRIHDWQALWQTEVDKRQQERHAALARAEHQARVEGQQEIVRRVAQGLEAVSDAGPRAMELFAWHVLQALERAIADDVRQARVSSEIVDTLDRLAGTIGLRTLESGDGLGASPTQRSLPDGGEEEPT